MQSVLTFPMHFALVFNAFCLGFIMHFALVCKLLVMKEDSN